MPVGLYRLQISLSLLPGMSTCEWKGSVMSKILRMNSVVGVLLVCALALTMMPGAFAQETTAGIQGYVKDPSGAVIAGATVEVSSPALIGEKKMETDRAGFYRFVNLP